MDNIVLWRIIVLPNHSGNEILTHTYSNNIASSRSYTAYFVWYYETVVAVH